MGLNTLFIIYLNYSVANSFERAPFIEKWELKSHLLIRKFSRVLIEKLQREAKVQDFQTQTKQQSHVPGSLLENHESIFNIHAKKFRGHETRKDQIMSIMSPSFNEAQLMHS